MRALSDSDFLALWESGLRRHPLDRALLALSAAFPETPCDRLADWPLGRRNRALVELHFQNFGHSLQGWLACARCAEKLEFALDGRVITGDGQVNDEMRRSDQPIVVDGRTFRLPTSRDLAAAAAETDPRRAVIRIVENCRIGQEDTPAWSDEELEKIGEAMASADPLAETLLDLHCSSCGREWQETLDLISFLWPEIEARARRLLLEVHALASAYGWTENEILSLSENRRAHYVGMVQS